MSGSNLHNQNLLYGNQLDKQRRPQTQEAGTRAQRKRQLELNKKLNEGIEQPTAKQYYQMYNVAPNEENIMDDQGSFQLLKSLGNEGHPVPIQYFDNSDSVQELIVVGD